MLLLLATPQIRLLPDEAQKCEEEEIIKEEEDFEMDIETLTTTTTAATNVTSLNEKQIRTSLDADDNSSSENFLKYCTSRRLADETEAVFRIITNFSLKDKLVLLDNEKLTKR